MTGYVSGWCNPGDDARGLAHHERCGMTAKSPVKGALMCVCPCHDGHRNGKKVCRRIGDIDYFGMRLVGEVVR